MKKRTFSRKYLGIPYALFLALFVAAPLIVLLYYRRTGAVYHSKSDGFFYGPQYPWHPLL